MPEFEYYYDYSGGHMLTPVLNKMPAWRIMGKDVPRSVTFGLIVVAVIILLSVIFGTAFGRRNKFSDYFTGGGDPYEGYADYYDDYYTDDYDDYYTDNYDDYYTDDYTEGARGGARRRAPVRASPVLAPVTQTRPSPGPTVLAPGGGACGADIDSEGAWSWMLQRSRDSLSDRELSAKMAGF